MSNIAYFTTSPAILMRARRNPPGCVTCTTWLAENDAFSSTTVFYYLCDGECTQSSFVLQSLEFAYFCNCDDCGSPTSAQAVLTSQNTDCTTTTTTTIAPTTTTTTAATTTTTTCGTYNIDIYAKSPKACQLNATGCDCGGFSCECAGELVTVTLEYSTDNGSSWFSAANFTGLDDQCTYIDTLAIGSCESSLIFRVSTESCTGVLFNYTANSSTCPAVGLCASSTCTETETINVMPTGNTSIAFSICTECVSGCCIPCCP